MKTNTDVFKDQPVIGEGEDATIGAWVSNWGTCNRWLQSDPDLVSLKKACLFEGEHQKRPAILDRLLSRIYKLEKAEALQRLLLTR